jgi:alkaline phosphatase
MKIMTLLMAGTMLAGTAASAQDIAQAGSSWYTDAEAALEARLARKQITSKAKNVILFIADGNGVGTNYAIRVFDGQQKGMLGEENVLPYEAFPYVALSKTYNVNAQTPDSAPTAGAMNSGVKQNFNTINLSEASVAEDCTTEAGNELTVFSELVTDAGKSVGFVTTARATHATPAGVYAKSAYRDWEAEVPGGCQGTRDIATQLIDAMKAGTVDFAMGGGRQNFVPAGIATEEGGEGERADGRNLIEEAKAEGFQYAWNTATVDELDLDGATPVLGLLEDSHMKYEFDRADDDEPSLTVMTERAIEFLSNNGEGYYLEVEAGRVDHASHDGNAFRTLTDGVEFAQAVARADELTDDADTLIIVTADHEHAIAFNGYCGRGTPIEGLCYEVASDEVKHSDTLALGDDGKPYSVIGYLNGVGSVLTPHEVFTEGDADEEAPVVVEFSGTRPEVTEEDASGPDYLQQALIPMGSETHSGEDVAIFAKGPWAHLVDGVVEQNYIFHVMNYAVNNGE